MGVGLGVIRGGVVMSHTWGVVRSHTWGCV